MAPDANVLLFCLCGIPFDVTLTLLFSTDTISLDFSLFIVKGCIDLNI